MTELIQKAWKYFLQRTKSVYVERYTNIETFEEYLSHRYRNNCYYYSAYSLMGMKPNDLLVRGFIDLEDRTDYHHGWVEFEFEGEQFVFDSMLKDVVPKQEYYEHFNPRVDYKKSQKDILDEFLNERCAIKVQDGFWQFKYLAINEQTENISHNEILDIDRNNGYVSSALMLARIEIGKFSGEIRRFIAYVEPHY